MLSVTPSRSTPRFALDEVGGEAPGLLDLVEHAARLGQQGLPRTGQPHRPAGPVEQPHAELAFEPGDLLADRGLGDVQPLGGPAEVQLLRDGGEVRQLTKLHPRPRPPPLWSTGTIGDRG
jgi:hypothetical protein